MRYRIPGAAARCSTPRRRFCQIVLRVSNSVDGKPLAVRLARMSRRQVVQWPGSERWKSVSPGQRVGLPMSGQG